MKIISGMHRSGTSMMAQLCFEAGGDLGDPKTFYRADKWNPDGYFEQPDIHRINMPLINGPWGKLAYLMIPSSRTILRRSDRISTRIQSTAEKYQGKIVKETRFCLTLDAWKRQGATIEKVLICLRDPIQVARSIKKRNKVPLRYGLHLWYLHNQRLLEQLGKIPVWFLSYNHLLNDDTSLQELKHALNFLGLHRQDDQITQLQKKVIKVHMNHFPDLSYNYPPKIEALWRRLEEEHRDQAWQYG